MYNSFRKFCERLLRIPHDPTPPPGDEASTRIFRAAPNYYKYLLFLWGLRTTVTLLPTLIAAVALFFVCVRLLKEGTDWGLLLLFVPALVVILHLLMSLFHLAIVRLDYEKRWYVVTDRSLRIREGVVAVREMTVNFANIQNISISQGPLQRLLRIADLRVDTAGGGGRAANTHHPAQNLHTAWFRGVDNANEVRELIQQRLRVLKDSGLGDHEEIRSSLPTASPSSLQQLSPAAISALREIHTEARALRQALNIRKA